MTKRTASIVLPPLVERALQRFVRAFAPQQVILFGSWAKGTTHDGSDVDLLIVVNLAGDSGIHTRRARQLCADSFPRIDVVFATADEVSAAHTAKSPFLASILGNGLVVYEKTAE
jgi:predicted nucleotidyltransferase